MTIKVSYEVYSTKWHIDRALSFLEGTELMSFDTETSGVYSKEERAQATAYLKKKDMPVDGRALALQVEENSGLSFPSLVKVTHFVFGLSEDYSVVIICTNPQLEIHIWNWLANYQGKLIVHNSLFDLKIMYNRIGKMPKDYEDSQLLAKCLTNNVEVYKSKVGLKDLMGSYYDPMWTLFEEYEPEDLKNEKFLMYAAIDGGATIKLWNEIKEYTGESNE